MTDGIINVNKPAGWTSQDVCTKLRHVLHIKKIGHTGTLDPMATGVLPVCMGKATRIIEYYERDSKSYHAAMKLLDNMMVNYSEWHTERAPQGKKVNSVEETSSLSDKIDAIILTS